MGIITIDWETYYDKDYSLTKLTTEEYVRDSRFEAIMLGIRMPDGEQRLIEGTYEEIQYKLGAIDWSQYAVLAHNMMFDGAILAWRFGIKPAVWLDTLSMARAMFGIKGNSLSALAARYNLDEKGTYVVNMMGKRRADMSDAEFKLYAQYCLKDVELCHQLFELMSQGWYDLESMDMRHPYPVRELELIDRLIRMYTEPSLVLNQDKLEKHLAGVIKRKEALLAACAVDKDLLMSNPKFAELLQNLGVTPPMKISPATGKLTFAFAKTDPGMKDLLEHPDERVQVLVSARMGVKSTLEETRTTRFIDIAKRGGLFPIPLKYSAARTHRLGGMDKINLQNLPARGKDAKRLKKAIEPLPGHIIINSDSSNIEARMLAWLAGQEDLVSDFANKVDVYSKMASRIYNREVNRKRKEVVDGKEIYPDEAEGFVGKTVVLGCFGPDTQVLTSSGWKSIVQVLPTDRLWDGESWVTHLGVLNKGFRQVETATDLMLSATGDHEILTEHGWREWSEVHSNRSLFQSAIRRGNLPSLIGNKQSMETRKASGITQWLNALVAGREQCIGLTSKIKAQKCVVRVPESKALPPGKNTLVTRILLKTILLGRACSTALLNVLADVGVQPTPDTGTTAAEGSGSTLSGYKTEGYSLSTSPTLKGGTHQKMNSTVLIMMQDMSRVIYGGLLGVKTCLTDAAYKICKKKYTVLKQRMQTYDIAYSGPNNRYTINTGKGPIIVHNCGYQTGGLKLQITLKAATPPMDMPLEECTRIVNTYRSTYPKIPELWKQGEKAIQAMHSNQSMWLGKEGVLWVEGKKGIKLPNGLYISYPSLHQYEGEMNGRPVKKWRYKDEKGLQDIYGGKLIENVVQGLARIIVMLQLLKIAKRYTVPLTVHDSVVAIAKVEEADEALAYIEECMRWIPKWAHGCPINCEAFIGANYGEC